MKFRALYYPSWNPPVRWLRSVLLVFDQIQVIRPVEVEDPQYHAANQAVFDLLPDVFGEIRKKHYELALDPHNPGLLTKSLGYIADRRRGHVKHTIQIHGNGSISVPGYVFLHVSKMPPFLSEELERLGLIDTVAERAARNMGNLDNFRVVQRDASNLILSLIADYYGQTEGLRTISNDRLSYLNVALNKSRDRRRAAAQMNLATMILQLEIPAEIADWTPGQYVSLRKRYDDLRVPFQHALATICDDQFVSQINSQRQFEEAVREAGRDFSQGVDRVRRSSIGKTVKKWALVSIGAFALAYGMEESLRSIIGSGIACGLTIYQGFGDEVPAIETEKAQKLLGELRAELASPILLRRLF